jgi:hypothetical protein
VVVLKIPDHLHVAVGAFCGPIPGTSTFCGATS